MEGGAAAGALCQVLRAPSSAPGCAVPRPQQRGEGQGLPVLCPFKPRLCPAWTPPHPAGSHLPLGQTPPTTTTTPGHAGALSLSPQPRAGGSEGTVLQVCPVPRHAGRPRHLGLGGSVAAAAAHRRGSLPPACNRSGIPFDWESNGDHLSPWLYGLPAAQPGWAGGSAHPEPTLLGAQWCSSSAPAPRVPSLGGGGCWQVGGHLRTPLGAHSGCQQPPSKQSGARAAPGLPHDGQLSQLAAKLAALSIFIIKN